MIMFQMPSSTRPDKSHTIVLDPLLERFTCSCGDWMKQDAPIDQRTCLHINTLALGFLNTLRAASGVSPYSIDFKEIMRFLTHMKTQEQMPPPSNTPPSNNGAA